MTVQVKICGLNDAASVAAAVAGGARYIGLVFYPPSPRCVSPRNAAKLAALAPPTVFRVGLFVDPDDETLRSVTATVRLDFLQLHGSESPDRVGDIKRLTGLPAIKAIKVATALDIAVATHYLGVADWLLFDAKAPADMAGALPGGNALRFDWQLLAGRRWPRPWMLSGGLDADNLAQAVRTSGARAVDVSSGVERGPGVKDPALIRAFLAVAAGL